MEVRDSRPVAVRESECLREPPRGDCPDAPDRLLSGLGFPGSWEAALRPDQHPPDTLPEGRS
jgi:hypothetical protein